ncbi:SDR family NAD(P)-dependent oxidoreductase [Microlunatus elymi]|uniref:SDR family NAD(P)-dependent oxidoreductase n=1 Tax=Microlunatus elymi TaxID=2596828 RepID=A0A516Q2G5_9ACTN|nr:SDR family oxidoreductase [Microlunatus elymi]QDP97627.1 SDR family NAD(P)-dependent oxidoreductase [Microlunatus elymi]
MTVALVTGASRGIGEATAVGLARRGLDVVINYRDKQARADRVVERIRAAGGQAVAIRADLTEPAAVESMVARTVREFGRLDRLVLNASGGLERDAPADYATQLNCVAQVRLADLAVEQMTSGGRIVFVTSHEAHFHGAGETLSEYAPVAASKRAGEDALLERAPGYAERGVSLVVVSGDLIDGTITAKLLDRARPGLIEQRRAEAGYLPSVDTFAAEVVRATLAAGPDPLILVGETRPVPDR